MRYFLFIFWVGCWFIASAEETMDGYHEFNYGKVKEDAKNWVQAIRVSDPAPRSEIEGKITIKLTAEEMTMATAFCWQQPAEGEANNWGKDVEITPGGIKLSADGNGSFEFDGEKFPHGPINLRIYAKNEAGKKDIFELQLYNKGGVRWNAGIPDANPPAAKGLDLIYADDFDSELSISNNGIDATYMAHKPGGGDFSGWQFSNVLGDGKPFAQKETWLKIAARKDEESPKGRSGIIASVNKDFEGVWAKPPCYLECRFTAQSAIGTWPAFWTLAFGDRGTDELDIIEAYGGKGKGNPNHPGYSIVSHFWNQYQPDGNKKKSFSTRVDMMDLGGKSYWSTTFHTYGVYIGIEETVYYFDDIEVLRHPTNSSSLSPHFFMINLAIGGISRWPIDLSRYNEGSDMWVDYVRVFAKEKLPKDFRPDRSPKPHLTSRGVGINFGLENQEDTQLMPDDVAGTDGVSHRNWNNLIGANGTSTGFSDSNNQTVEKLAVIWSVPGKDDSRLQRARDWGFKKSNLKLQRGYINPEGEIEISNIPYSKYDVFLYFNGGDNWGSGSATLTSGDVKKTHFYNVGWLGGKFKTSEITSLDAVKDSNVIVFRNNTSDKVKLTWNGKLKNGWTGITGLQIVER